MASLQRLNDSNFVLNLDDEPAAAPRPSRAQQLTNHLIASLPQNGGQLMAGGGSTSPMRKAPNGELMKPFGATVTAPNKTTPPPPDPAVLAKLLTAIQDLTTQIQQLTSPPAQDDSDQARGGKASATARRLVAINRALGAGYEKFALKSLAAGYSPSQARAALDADPDTQWSNPAVRNAYSDNRAYFMAAVRHDAEQARIAATRERIKAAKAAK